MSRAWKVLVLAGALALALAGQARAIVGGELTPIERVPWQAVVTVPGSNCGAAIIEARRVLTAAHCVLGATPATTHVVAGTANRAALPAGAQRVAVAGIRVHPGFVERGQPDDDVAVITTAAPLAMTAAVQAVPMAPPGAAPPPAGSLLTVSGYGAQARVQAAPDGLLRVAQLGPTRWQQNCMFADNHDAVIHCTPNTPAAGTCHGDSGGPLVAGAPPVLIGIVTGAGDFGPCDEAIGTYTDVAAPEIRASIDGSDAPPRAPRGDAGGLKPGVGLRAGDAARCEPGTWSDAPQLTFEFVLFPGTDESPASEPAVLQSGPSPRYVTTRLVAGRMIGCLVKAATAGGEGRDETYGVDVERSATRPRVRITSARCRGRRCTVRFTVGEQRSVAGPSRIDARAGKRKLRVRRIGTDRYVARGSASRGPVRVRVRAVSAASGKSSRTATRTIRR